MARVTRKLGSPVLTTSTPLTTPISSAASSRRRAPARCPSRPRRSAAPRAGRSRPPPPRWRSRTPRRSAAARRRPRRSRAGGDVEHAGEPTRGQQVRHEQPEQDDGDDQAAQRRGARTGERPVQQPAARGPPAPPSRSRRRRRRSPVRAPRARTADGRVSAARPPRRVGVPVSTTRRVRGSRRSGSGVQAPPDAVVGVPGPALHGAAEGDAIADDPCGVAGDLQRAAHGAPGRPQRLQPSPSRRWCPPPSSRVGRRCGSPRRRRP